MRDDAAPLPSQEDAVTSSWQEAALRASLVYTSDEEWGFVAGARGRGSSTRAPTEG